MIDRCHIIDENKIPLTCRCGLLQRFCMWCRSDESAHPFGPFKVRNLRELSNVYITLKNKNSKKNAI